MRYRTIDVRIWGDERFCNLTPLQPSGQALFLYLLTNPNVTVIPGLYRAGAAAIAEELGWNLEGFNEAFGEVLNQGLAEADLKARLIFIPNAIKYNKPQSPNVVKSWASHWDELPECDLKTHAYKELKAFLEGLGKAFGEAFDKAIVKPSRKTMLNQEQEQEQEKINLCEAKASLLAISEDLIVANTLKKDSTSKDVQAIFLHWQQIMNHPQAKLDKKRRSKIEAALKLGFTIDQLKQAIDGCALTSFNMGDNLRSQRYDGIDLIFRDAEHIERFIAASENHKAINAINSSNPIFRGVI
jgi:DNA-binding XRE family transcriptional regulator